MTNKNKHGLNTKDKSPISIYLELSDKEYIPTRVTFERKVIPWSMGTPLKWWKTLYRLLLSYTLNFINRLKSDWKRIRDSPKITWETVISDGRVYDLKEVGGELKFIKQKGK